MKPRFTAVFWGLLLFPLCCHAQGGTPVDCSSTFTFTAAALQTGQLNQSQSTPCIAFRVTFSVTSTLTAVIQFETSPDNSTWTAVPNTICSSTVQPPCIADGANPMASGATGMVAVRAYGKYWRLNVVSTTGSGTGTARVYGYKGTSAGGGGGGVGGVGPAGPAGTGSGGSSGWSGQPLTFATTTTQYAPYAGGGLPSATETAVSTKASGAQTVSNLHVTIDASLGASATLAITLESGTATASALTCITAGGGTSCDDITHSVNVTDQTLLSWKLVSSGVVTAGLPQIKISYAVGLTGVGVTQVSTCFPIGANNGAALADADLGPQSRQYFVNAAATVLELEVAADAGTPNIILGRSRAGTIVNLTSAALATAASGGIACANTGGTLGIDGATTCSGTLQNTGLNAGDWITLVSGTAGGAAKEMTACITRRVL